MLGRTLNQKITRWTVSIDGFGGFVFGSPTTINGRWEDKNEIFTYGAGETLNAQSVVYLESDVVVGDYLYLGESAAVDPTALEGAGRVKRFDRTADLRNVRTVRRAYL